MENIKKAYCIVFLIVGTYGLIQSMPLPATELKNVWFKVLTDLLFVGFCGTYLFNKLEK